jgi:hypothetical protein
MVAAQEGTGRCQHAEAGLVDRDPEPVLGQVRFGGQSPRIDCPDRWDAPRVWRRESAGNACLYALSVKPGGECSE